jgi:tight adherence protein C
VSLYLIVALGILSALLVIIGLRGQGKGNPEMEDRLHVFGNRFGGADARASKESFSARVLKPSVKRWSTRLGQRSPGATLDRTRLKLSQAGSPSGLGPIEFVGLRYLVSVGMAAGGFLLFTVSGTSFTYSVLVALFGGIFGFLLPNIWLDRKVKGRRKDIMKSLPDAIDLLTISVESGLGFDPAMQRVAEKWDNALTREFARVLSEMRIGKSKREALREMALRADEDGLTTFVSSVIQADTLGVPITQVLRIQSEAMRVRRRQRAEELAQKAPLKMLFPMVFLVFPALYVVILGPAVPQIMDALK